MYGEKAYACAKEIRECQAWGLTPVIPAIPEAETGGSFSLEFRSSLAQVSLIKKKERKKERKEGREGGREGKREGGKRKKKGEKEKGSKYPNQNVNKW